MPNYRWKFKAAKRAAGRDKFLHTLPNHHVLFARRSAHLVVSFDNKQQDKRNGQIYPWAFDFLQKGDFSHLGIMVNDKNDWFRDPALFDYFDDLRGKEFFQQFETVTFFGSSMGDMVRLLLPRPPLMPMRSSILLSPRLIKLQCRGSAAMSGRGHVAIGTIRAIAMRRII
jgi:hypothetical protein